MNLAPRSTLPKPQVCAAGVRTGGHEPRSPSVALTCQKALLTALWASGATGCALAPPALPDLQPIAAMAAEVDAARLMPDVERLAQGHLQDVKLSCEGFPAMERYPACELSRDDAVGFVRDRFSSLGFAVEVVALGEAPNVAKNVVVEQRGTARANEVVLVAAHLDAFFAGADDDSSGVAALLELARVAAQHRFERSLRFIAFDLEERGSLGSLRYVQAGMADDVVAALVLECLGRASDAPHSQKSPPGLPLGDVANSLAVAGNDDSRPMLQRVLAIDDALHLVPLRGLTGGGDGLFPLIGALTRSDNGPLWFARVPALLFSDTADYRNPDYHEPGDTPDKLNPEFLAASTRMLAATLAVLAVTSP